MLLGFKLCGFCFARVLWAFGHPYTTHARTILVGFGPQPLFFAAAAHLHGSPHRVTTPLINRRQLTSHRCGVQPAL